MHRKGGFIKELAKEDDGDENIKLSRNLKGPKRDKTAEGRKRVRNPSRGAVDDPDESPIGVFFIKTMLETR